MPISEEERIRARIEGVAETALLIALNTTDEHWQVMPEHLCEGHGGRASWCANLAFKMENYVSGRGGWANYNWYDAVDNVIAAFFTAVRLTGSPPHDVDAVLAECIEDTKYAFEDLADTGDD